MTFANVDVCLISDTQYRLQMAKCDHEIFEEASSHIWYNQTQASEDMAFPYGVSISLYPKVLYQN